MVLKLSKVRESTEKNEENPHAG